MRVARAFGELPQIAAALRAGQVSHSKVRALTRVATATNEASLLDIGRASTVSQPERVFRGLRLALRDADGDERREDEPDLRWLRERETAAGLVRVDMQLRAQGAGVLRRAREAAMARAWGRTPPRPAPRRLARAAGSRGRRREQARPHGRRSRGDAVGVVGRRRRTLATLLRRALRLRDRGCRCPRLSQPPLDAHHVVPWARGGPTTLASTVCLCRRHGTAVHELGFQLERDAGGGVRCLDPSGRALEAASPPPALGAAPVDHPWAHPRADGIAIDAETAFPRWDGRPADYDPSVWCLAAGAAAG